jgi:putative transposase
MLFGQIRKNLAKTFHDLARQKESQIEEGHLCKDHVHMLISIPPKHSVSEVVGFLKGKTAIYIARAMGHRRNFVGQNFWARGYYVSTVGRDEKVIREYIRTQENQDKKLDEGDLFRNKQ